MIKCVLFDLDGVLVDACEWHRVSLNKALSEVANIQISDEEHHTTFNGLPTKKKLELLVSQGKIDESKCNDVWAKKQEYTKETIVSIGKLDSIKVELHSYIKQNNIKIACITNSIIETTSLMLTTTGQYDYMDLIISNEMVRQPKPHGEGYIRGMIKFRSLPEETIIVEDSEVGLKAARSTGANIWQVRDTHDVNLENFKKELAKW